MGSSMARCQRGLRGFEELRLNDWRESACCTDPHVRRIYDALLFELDRYPVEDVVADIFLIAEHRLNRAGCPRPAQIRLDLLVIEIAGDLAWRLFFIYEHTKHSED